MVLYTLVSLRGVQLPTEIMPPAIIMPPTSIQCVTVPKCSPKTWLPYLSFGLQQNAKLSIWLAHCIDYCLGEGGRRVCTVRGGIILAKHRMGLEFEIWQILGLNIEILGSGKPNHGFGHLNPEFGYQIWIWMSKSWI